MVRYCLPRKASYLYYRRMFNASKSPKNAVFHPKMRLCISISVLLTLFPVKKVRHEALTPRATQQMQECLLHDGLGYKLQEEQAANRRQKP